MEEKEGELYSSGTAAPGIGDRGGEYHTGDSEAGTHSMIYS